MRICLLGSLSSSQLDEGMKNVAFHLMREITKDHSLLGLDPRGCTSFTFWRQIKAFRPEIIHYTSGPTIRSLLLLRLLKTLIPDSKTVVYALHPWFGSNVVFFIRFVKPDLVLVQSDRTKKLFTRWGCQTRFLPNGVATQRFKPLNLHMRVNIRKRLNVPEDKFVILHVGPVKENRGLKDLIHLQVGDQQVLIVGSPSTGYDPATMKLLEERGCMVWRRYFEDIENIYGLSDCYVFPTRDPLHAIEMPLSVLEAMSCNLPVISYAFGGLPSFFHEGEGLAFHQTTNGMIQNLNEIRAGMSIQTRRKVRAMDWTDIGSRLKDVYRVVV